jgi:Protein of unknown function (DUF2934)
LTARIQKEKAMGILPGHRNTIEPDHFAVDNLAFDLWCLRGCPEGSPEVDWFAAEKQLKSERPMIEEAVKVPVPILMVKSGQGRHHLTF